MELDKAALDRWLTTEPDCCGPYRGTHQEGEPNAFCDCSCHEETE